MDRVRTSVERVRRWQTYVDRIRAWIRRSPEDTYVGRTNTLIEYIRRKTRACIVEICSRDMRTLSELVRQAIRTYGRKTYVGRIRTSTNHVHQYNVAESRSSYARKMRTSRKIRTSVEDVHASQHRRICIHDCRSPNLPLHSRSWNPMCSLR